VVQSISDQNITPDGPDVLHTVFLSYSRADQKDANLIIKALQQAGYSVWWDGLLEGGERFANTTESALANAKAVVVLWSKTSIGSHWVHDEATRGRDSKKLVPLSLDGSDPPLGFGQFQCIDVSRSKSKPSSAEITKMLRAVAALHDAEVSPAISAAPASPVLGRRGMLIGGTAAVAVVGGLAAWKTGIFGGGPSASSIAVLPFVNLSGDPEQAYFSDGLASEIRTVLSRNKLLQIVGQASSNTFRDHKSDARTIAKKLAVSFLLDGNVQKSGDMVKITTDLTDGKTGLSKWTDTFERPLVDIFSLQSEIASAVASALSVAIDSGSKVDDDKLTGGTKNLAAFDAYLRGKDQFELHVDEVGQRAALAKFDEAIEIDPKYAAALAARSRVLAVIAGQYEKDNAARFKLLDDAVVEAIRATEIAPEFAPGHSALGYSLLYGKLDVKGARAPFEKSNSLSRSDVDVLTRYAIFCARMGRFAEADLAIARATELDPLSSSVFKAAGSIKYAARKYTDAITLGQQALKINPERSVVHSSIGDSYLMLGQIDKARESYSLESSESFKLAGLAILEHRAGDEAKAQEYNNELVAIVGDSGLYQQAEVLAQWGDIDGALAALNKARTTRDAGIIYILNDPFLDPLREDARFKRLLSDMGFL
jgi:TolB-like protein/tetratricopeptide (TPR) repeat protein